MLNVIKMDLYRMFRQVSFYVILVILGLFLFFSTLMINEDLEVSKGTETGIEVGENHTNVNVGIYVNANQSSDKGLDVLDLTTAHASSVILVLFMTIFCTIFVCNEKSSGFIKNTASKVRKRWYLVISKVVSMSFFVLLEFTLLLILVPILSKAILGYVYFERIGQLFTYISIQMLLHIGCATLIILIAYLTKNPAVTMALGICFSFGVFSLVTSFIDMLKVGTNSLNLSITDYTLYHNIQALNFNGDNSILIRAVGVSIFFILLYTFITSIIAKKQDIN